MTELSRVLVANRGEIAVRVIRAARDEGLTSIAVHGSADAQARHVRLADEAVSLGEGTPAETYLSIPAVIAAAADSGADAIHPGYGFLSENAEFAQAVLDAGLTWIGPSPDAIRQLGDKVRAREIARRVGAPLVPGSDTSLESAADVESFADRHGLPVAIKAAFGGGGRGLKVARTREEIPELFESAVREARAAFGRGECYVERYLDRPRHVEAQVLADQHGRVVVVGTRDCSLQRRHQKLVEEAPAPFLFAEQVARIRESAAAICREARYTGAGTVEYLVGRDGTLSFLEVNTRLQVEHPVTEETAGIDLVRQMFRIASGRSLTIADDPEPHGHAFEFRINAEDPARGFLPTPGTVTGLTVPEGPGVRFDSGVEAGEVVDGGFDSLLAKLVVSGADRAEALERSRRALAELDVQGLVTVVPFHRAVVDNTAFTATGPDGFAVHTSWIETEFDQPLPPADPLPEPDVVRVAVGGRALSVRVPGLGRLPGADAIRARAESARASIQGTGAVAAPMQGTVVKVAVVDGQEVVAGELIAVVEAMKMEIAVTAPRTGSIAGLRVRGGRHHRAGRLDLRGGLMSVPRRIMDDWAHDLPWETGGAYAVAPGVHRVPLPLPDQGLRAVNVYVIDDDGGPVLVDSGHATLRARETLTEGLALLGYDEAEIRRCLVTHVHRDHYTQAVELRRDHGIRIGLGQGERESLAIAADETLAPIAAQLRTLATCGAAELVELNRMVDHDLPPGIWEKPDQWFRGGDEIPVGSRRLDVFETPGHTKGHVVFRDDQAALLFAGDHVLPHITPSIGFEPVSGPRPLADYLTSLRKVRDWDDTWLLPAHGPVTISVHARVEELLEHHAQRLAVMLADVLEGANTAFDVARRVRWTSRGRAFDSLSPFNRMLAVLETKAHLDVLVDRGRLKSFDDDGTTHYTTGE